MRMWTFIAPGNQSLFLEQDGPVYNNDIGSIQPEQADIELYYESIGYHYGDDEKEPDSYPFMTIIGVPNSNALTIESYVRNHGTFLRNGYIRLNTLWLELEVPEDIIIGSHINDRPYEKEEKYPGSKRGYLVPINQEHIMRELHRTLVTTSRDENALVMAILPYIKKEWIASAWFNSFCNDVEGYTCGLPTLLYKNDDLLPAINAPAVTSGDGYLRLDDGDGNYAAVSFIELNKYSRVHGINGGPYYYTILEAYESCKPESARQVRNKVEEKGVPKDKYNRMTLEELFDKGGH